jgi:hypothetical protein
MKIALCFWGLCRSTEHTIESIEECILKPLKKAGISYDIYLHTYTLYRSYTNIRSKEYNLHLKNTLWKLLNPKDYILEHQDAVDMKLELAKYRTHGNPWEGDDGGSFSTLDNHIRALWSLNQVTSLWRGTGIVYDAVMYLRPDVQFLTYLHPTWLQNLTQSLIRIPNFHLMDGCNDRFAIGTPPVMEVYGKRYTQAYEYSLRNSLHSEKFLAHSLNKHTIQIEYIPIRFRRIRATGEICPADKDL